MLLELLATGAPVPSKEIRAEAEARSIPWHYVRFAKDRLPITARPRHRTATVNGKKTVACWEWSMVDVVAPAAPTRTQPAAPPASPSAAAAPQGVAASSDGYSPPPADMDRAARAELTLVNGRWTHPLGDEEYRRLCTGGRPLLLTENDPWRGRR